MCSSVSPQNGNDRRAWYKVACMQATVSLPERVERDMPAGVRPPVANERFPYLDAVRAVAVTCVFVSHAFNAWWAAYMNIGVPMFFAVSGFLLYRPFVAARLGEAPSVGVSA